MIKRLGSMPIRVIFYKPVNDPNIKGEIEVGVPVDVFSYDYEYFKNHHNGSFVRVKMNANDWLNYIKESYDYNINTLNMVKEDNFNSADYRLAKQIIDKLSYFKDSDKEFSNFNSSIRDAYDKTRMVNKLINELSNNEKQEKIQKVLKK